MIGQDSTSSVYRAHCPDAKAIEVLHKTWARHQLSTYLQRWKHTRLPEIPADFWSYSWRSIDLGSGFGKYLLEESAAHPDKAFLGIDKGTLRGGKMVERARQVDRPNLFAIHGNAIPILAGLPDTCLNRLTIFYPNPWWPAKHRKKRWSYHPLLPKLAKALVPGGEIWLTSNESFYLDEWNYALNHHPDLPALEGTYAGPIRTTVGRTHFETKFLAQGVPCGEVVFRRAANGENTPGLNLDGPTK